MARMGGENRAVADAADKLARGREAYSAEAWIEAYESLSAADRSDPLAPEDLELLAACAYMLGREDEYLATLERAHRAHLGANDYVRAVRAAFWIGIQSRRAARWRGQAAGWGARPG